MVAQVVLEKVQGVRASYRTLIRRGEDVVAEIKSSWCCLDAETRRPVRPAREVIERFLSRG
jgi:acyl-CoA thioester hydrolase